MKCLLLAGLLVTACDKLPDRPDDTKFKAMDDYDKCRVTASRAILCTDEIMVAQLRALAGPDGAGEMADAVAEDLGTERKLPKQERKESIAVHKNNCAAEPHYVDAVFSCWAIEDCKKFATCVVETHATQPGPAPK